MENLSDVEFGTKSSEEEAPILIAQRYLNIFRQVHIFNKATRDKFDDELLALPDNVINFIKRMPGGRLLIEHIEDVKTDRGISFVKTRRDEFSNSTDSGASGGATVPVQGGGGNVVMDASFAEILSKSLAVAFKNAPSGHVSSSSADMGQAFELMTEEIRASHASLLDVLKETRNITDSVIASQVSISRILEGVLSSRGSDGSNTDLNNQILASQASITKLLENLYQSNSQKNFSTAPNFDIENRLSQFEHEIKNEIKSMLGNYTPNRVNHTVNNGNQQVDFLAKEERNFSDDEFRKNKKKKNKNKTQMISSSVPLATAVVSSSNANAMDMVMHNINEVDLPSSAPSFDGVIRNSNYKYEDDFSNVNLDEPPLEGDISNSSIKEQEIIIENSLTDFSPLNNLDLPSTEESKVSKSANKNDFSSITSSSDDSLNLDDLTIKDDIVPQVSDDNADLSLDNLSVNDDLDIKLSDDGNNALDALSADVPHDNIISGNFPTSALDNPDTEVIENSIAEIDKTIKEPSPAADAIIENINLDDFSIEKSANMPLSEETSSDNDINVSLDDLSSGIADIKSQDINLDDFSTEDNISSTPLEDTSSINLDNFSTENNISGISSEETQDINLDDFSTKDNVSSTPLEETNNINLDGFSTEDNTNVISVDEETPSINLDDFSTEDNINSTSFEETNNINLDDFSAENNITDISIEEDNIETQDNIEQKPSHPSRYSDTLDKIRDALTSDSIDIASLDEPIALDDYSDDENVTEVDDMPVKQTTSSPTSDDEWEYEYVEDDGSSDENASSTDDDEEWEYEYVDENGNIVTTKDKPQEGEDWEWEYVDDKSSDTSNDENKPQ